MAAAYYYRAMTDRPKAAWSQGNARHVLRACANAAHEPDAVLALVLERAGSTYADAGALALFGAKAGQVGWLSGGCLEPEIERHAQAAARDGRIGWLEVDTRDDEDLLSGSALGCRGRLRIALLPVSRLPGSADAFMAWDAGRAPLDIALDTAGAVSLQAAQIMHRWQVAAGPCEWQGADAWVCSIPPPADIRLFGAGPETALLLRLLRDLGWRTTVVERRERWRSHAALADRHMDAAPGAAAEPFGMSAALVMHHNFELDREALAALAATDVPYIGLLGPARRREDLFKLLSSAQRECLRARLHAPVGLDLGGRGAEAIALSIAAQLQAWRHAQNAAG